MTGDMYIPERITIRWAGEVKTVDVVKRFKNGKVRVEWFDGTGWTPGHRFGYVPPPTRVTVEPWQIVEEKV